MSDLDRYELSRDGLYFAPTRGDWVKFKDAEKLQAKIDFKDNIIEMADENVKKLQARIDELEDENEKLRDANIAHAKHSDFIKAEGIRQMRQHFKKRSDEFNGYGVSLLEMAIYADKLEKGE